MKRLTTWYDGSQAVCEDAEKCDMKFRPVADPICNRMKEIIGRLYDIENILGDDYDLERLAELVKANKKGWIPCISGIMPDAEQEVRVVCETSAGYEYQCQAIYIPIGVYRDDSEYSWDWECCEEYDENRGDYMVNPGWYECIHNWDDYSAVEISDTVTYWTPLPELPKLH